MPEKAHASCAGGHCYWRSWDREGSEPELTMRATLPCHHRREGRSTRRAQLDRGAHDNDRGPDYSAVTPDAFTIAVHLRTSP
jgi:hypothetical protein